MSEKKQQQHVLKQKQQALAEGRDGFAIYHDDDPVSPVGQWWSTDEVTITRDALKTYMQYLQKFGPELPPPQRLAFNTMALEAGLDELLPEGVER